MSEAKLKEWMQWLREQFLALVTDDDTYWRLNKEVIQGNHRLLTMKSPFFDMLHYGYVCATASAIRRLTEKQNRDSTNVSLRIVLEQLQQDTTIFAEVPRAGLQADLCKLEDVENKIKPYVDRAIAHHDRRGVANSPKYGDLREGVLILGEIFRRYYGLIDGCDLSLKIVPRRLRYL